ncbi:uncharacterized protein [Diadema antillarum]|uniref:uncharacterized protein n=1 Tax=Diadema antillarum TaxID=105358 RepID=UPI003A8C0DF3
MASDTELCRVIVDEYINELLSVPTSWEEHRAIAYGALTSYANYKLFIWEDIGGHWSLSDAQIWDDFDLKEANESREPRNPWPGPLTNDTQPIYCLYFGDDGFGVCQCMQKLFGYSNLTREESIPNYQLSKSRRVSENAFGILANRSRL